MSDAAAVLSYNVGSSSVRFAGHTLTEGRAISQFRGLFDASTGGPVSIRSAAGEETLDIDTSNRPHLIREIFRIAQDRLPAPLVVGHRVLHHGGHYRRAVRLTPDTTDVLMRLAPLGPLHQKANLLPAQVLADADPELRQVAVFDCAFHDDLPALARRLPLSVEAAGGLRRFGFHGLSYAHVAAQMRALAPQARRVVAVHLGGGASLCAMQDGVSIDTTMSTTPLDGLMMATRSGAIDPGVVLLLCRAHGVDAVEQMLWRDSGLKGVSGISGDLRDLIGSGQTAAEEAVALYCRSIVRALGGMVAMLGGLDALVFTGGAGVGQPLVRARVSDDLRWLGVMLDDAANTGATGPKASKISAEASRVQVFVVPTDEEQVIADAVTVSLGELGND